MTEAAGRREQWLVRTSQNEIHGPYTKEALISQLREGKLGAQDEICRGNHYWIYLDEREEVKAQLGIELQRIPLPSGPEEITDTETQTVTQEVGSSLNSPQGPLSDEIPELGEEVTEDQTLIANRALRRFDAEQSKRFDRRSFRRQEVKPLVLGRVERPSFWRFVISGLIILTGFLVAWVIRVLQAS